jgi:hypothetical protein
MPRSLTRRTFLLGAGATGVLASCGEAGGQIMPPQVVSLFSTDHVIAAGMPQRIPFAVVDIGDLAVAETAEVPVTVRFGQEVIEHSTVTGRLVEHEDVSGADPDHQHANLLRYYALRTELPQPGIYDVEVDFAGQGVATLPIQAFDPAEISVVLPGQRLPPLATPTTADPEGISPLCTREPACPLHDVAVGSVLEAAEPLALLVATPALCQTAYCGPVLDTLLAQASDFPHITMVHLEVYANAAEVDGNYADPAIEVAAPVIELGLTFEPSLFLVDRSGTVVDRIDNIYDAAELRSALAVLS